MPSIPDIPGKGLLTDTTKRARLVAGAAATGALAAGGLVAKRVLAHAGHGGDEERAPVAEASPIPTAVEEKPAPKPQPAKPKAAGPQPPKAGDKPKPPTPKADKPKPPTPKAEKPKPAKPKPPMGKAEKPKSPKPKADKPKAAKPKPAKPKPKAAKKAKPAVEPGDRSHDKEPHHALNNPVADPDETEYPDPFEKRDDPRDPVDPDGAPFGEEPHPQVGSESTSEPPPSQDPEVGDLAKPPKRDKLDD